MYLNFSRYNIWTAISAVGLHLNDIIQHNVIDKDDVCDSFIEYMVSQLDSPKIITRDIYNQIPVSYIPWLNKCATFLHKINGKYIHFFDTSKIPVMDIILLMKEHPPSESSTLDNFIHEIVYVLGNPIVIDKEVYSQLGGTHREYLDTFLDDHPFIMINNALSTTSNTASNKNNENTVNESTNVPCNEKMDSMDDIGQIHQQNKTTFEAQPDIVGNEGTPSEQEKLEQQIEKILTVVTDDDEEWDYKIDQKKPYKKATRFKTRKLQKGEKNLPVEICNMKKRKNHLAMMLVMFTDGTRWWAQMNAVAQDNSEIVIKYLIENFIDFVKVGYDGPLENM